VTTQDMLWTGAAVATVIAIGSAFAEHRRTHRRDLDKVGLMPWNFIQVIAFLAAILAAALALKM
jgi:hypothetical protein